MYGIVARIWNQIARTQNLKTELAKQLFPLSEEKLLQSLDQRHQRMKAEGTPGVVVLAFLTMAPLLWEREAIALHKARSVLGAGALPEVLDVGEALIYATREWRLSEPEQNRLRTLLENPT